MISQAFLSGQSDALPKSGYFDMLHVMQMTNLEIAELLRRMAAAYQILDENRFRIIAYDRAADSIEHSTSEVKDLWDDGKLKDIPGVGPAIADYLDELFKTGRVKHFDSTMNRVPQAVFPLLLVPGIGPKKAYKLVKTMEREPELFREMYKQPIFTDEQKERHLKNMVDFESWLIDKIKE